MFLARLALPATVLALAGCAASFPKSLADAAAAGRPGIRTLPVNEAQGPAYVSDPAYAKLTPQNARVVVSLAEQRARVYAGTILTIDTPVSTGTRSHPTPRGEYRILEKRRSYRSNLFGNYVDASGAVVQRNVDIQRDPPPEGARFVGTSMPYWQRLTGDGVGMHIGPLPGSPASHGCLRFPSKVMPLIYEKTRVGTPVSVQ
jgi:lipoprotein-anchoring transpeptidase ErfK/SrfK